MSDKTINFLLTLAAIGLVIYGIFNMTTKKKDKEDTKDNKQIEFNYKEELTLVDSIVLDEDLKFDNNTKLRIALSNINSKDIKSTKDTFNDLEYYMFTGSYIKASTMKKYLDDLFGKDNYKLENFYDGDNWYLYDKNDKCFYIFMSTLVTNCSNSNDTELATNCIEIAPKCDLEYVQDDTNIIVNVSCVEGYRTEYKDYDYEYSYKYIYNYDSKNKDYYISDIKLIKE